MYEDWYVTELVWGFKNPHLYDVVYPQPVATDTDILDTKSVAIR